MTIAEAWDILAAVDALARVHGWECVPTVRLRCLHIELQRGFCRRRVLLTEDQLNACGSVEAVRELVEREVAAALVGQGATA